MSDSAGGRDDTAIRLLDAAIHSLRTDVLPLLGEDVGRMRVDHVTRLLRAVSARLTQRQDGLQTLIATAVNAGIAARPAPGEPVEAQRQALERAMSQALPALLDAATQGDTAALDQLDAIIAMEKAFFVAHDPDILQGSQVAYRGGRIDHETPVPRAEPWPVIDESSLSGYLHRRFGRDDVRAEGIRAIPGGFSKGTVFFTLVDDAEQTRRDLVMRKDIPLPFIDKTVADEFGLLQALHQRGFPVAKPMWLETDLEYLGASFIVSERVRGTSNAASWAADPARAAKACRELARILAQLHRFDPAELGYPNALTSRSAGELMQAELARWTALFHDRRRESIPLQELPLVWLARNIPEALYRRPARVVHGDFGFHNLMFDDQGEVTALLDWEFSVLGEPTQDLCFVRLFIEPLMDWREFLALYRDAGGPPPCDEAVFFFDLWTKTRNSVGCVAAQRLFDTALPRETKFALAGHVFAPYLCIDECESLMAHLKNGRA
jgi:aminoglycoside phosphotransferase (APT) family kinase protein